jgi:hypothetical protein
MTRQPFYPFRSERAKAEYEARSLERAKAWPVPSETMFLDTPSGQTFVRASGRLVRDRPLTACARRRADRPATAGAQIRLDWHGGGPNATLLWLALDGLQQESSSGVRWSREPDLTFSGRRCEE